ncbi:MAG: family 16 glycosylhydrolase, partial [Gammaproteobacteria bacterium]|nr:family 16 glycosylhydrolase [Gammaproteobacteria bacterium]
GDDFHLFEADWDQDRIIGRIDGIQYFELDIEPATMEEFLREFFMLLNVAMGGTLGSNNQDPSGDEVWPQTMLVDYVRVFQRTDAPTPELFIDFEGSPADFTFNGFGGTANGTGGLGDVIMNPVQEGINTSAQVGRIQKFNGELSAGATLVTSFDVPPQSGFTMKVWSPRAVDVLFKLEGTPSAETSVRHGGTGWEELTFSFGDFTTTATGITFFFDNGIPGDAENNPADWTFYIDDIRRSQVLSQIDLPITFDDANVDYTLTDFGDPVAAITTLAEDPDDVGNTVASTTKPAGAPVWAGTTMSTQAGLATAIPFTDSLATVAVRVYSPAAGIPVRLKADDVVNGSVSVETELTTTVANEWETLVFNFADEVEGTAALDTGVSYTALSIFFDFGTDGNDATYLWDDVEFGVALPDTTAPTLTSVSIESANANNNLATTGDLVTVSLTADESISAPVVTIGGVAASMVAGGGASWEASRTITAADTDGVLVFSIEFSDLAGNDGVAVSGSTDASTVTIDATSPSVMIMGAPETFTSLDPIMLTFQFSEPVTGFTLSDIMRAGGGASAFTVVDADTYTANLTPNGTGNLVLGIAAGIAIDAAGNANTAAIGVTIVNDLDADAPLLTSVSLSSSNTNPAYARTGDVVTIDLVANEDINEPVISIAGSPADLVTGAGTTWQ